MTGATAQPHHEKVGFGRGALTFSGTFGYH
jgi:hypothetical protein